VPYPGAAVALIGGGRGRARRAAQQRKFAEQCRHDLDDIEPVAITARVDARQKSHGRRILTVNRAEPLSLAGVSGQRPAVTANALSLLRRAAETGGLKLTATGNLSRAVVEEMLEIIKAPDYDKDVP
jgi:hypothetical protein